MKRNFSTILFMPLLLTFAACSSDKPKPPSEATDAGTTVDGDGGSIDSGEDAGAAPVAACSHDQGGAANHGCEPGFVCNLATDPPSCVKGTSCQSNDDCKSCAFDVTAPGDPVADCGHGFRVNSWCDPNHGNVCTRSLADCEPCKTDADCGLLNLSIVPVTPMRCLAYPDGKHFCGSPATASCPKGFEKKAMQVNGKEEIYCVQPSGCPDEPTFCAADPKNASPLTGQIATNSACEGQDKLHCTTNNMPGKTGTCLPSCQSNDDCPANAPRCDLDQGICREGCVKGSCAEGYVCNLNGKCSSPCENNESCEERYGENSYCNGATGNTPPRYYKDLADHKSCQKLGCETDRECGEAGKVCDKTQTVPICVDGCYTNKNCLDGEVCRAGDQGNYDITACRNLPPLSSDAVGVCCNPGCMNRHTDCPQDNNSTVLQMWCCGEPGSPFEDESSCTMLTAKGTEKAIGGQCFDVNYEGHTQPFCELCDAKTTCDSGSWDHGKVTDSRFNNGAPFKEQEFCRSISKQSYLCAVTCNPNPENGDTGCPSSTPCTAVQYGCMQDAHCGSNGSACVGAQPDADPPVMGRCSCTQDSHCTDRPARLTDGFELPPSGVIERPRCSAATPGATGVCIAGHNCKAAYFDPKSPNYDAVCAEKLR